MHILMIEDDVDLCLTVSFILENEGYDVTTCHSGKAGLDAARLSCYDLILLDRMLPVIDGLTVLQLLRQEQVPTPVLMLTALSTLNDKVTGLDAGADDYLSKPFEVEELLARIRVLLRRTPQLAPSARLTYNDHTLDLLEKKLMYNQHVHALTTRELRLFELFFNTPEQPLMREQIISKIWGPDALIEDGNLDNYIYFLRRILKELHSPLVIKTIRGIGFKFTLEANK